MFPSRNKELSISSPSNFLTILIVAAPLTPNYVLYSLCRKMYLNGWIEVPSYGSCPASIYFLLVHHMVRPQPFDLASFNLPSYQPRGADEEIGNILLLENTSGSSCVSRALKSSHTHRHLGHEAAELGWGWGVRLSGAGDKHTGD